MPENYVDEEKILNNRRIPMTQLNHSPEEVKVPYNDENIEGGF